MNKDIIPSLIDDLYELAGLLHVANGEGGVPTGLPERIRHRTEEISARCLSLADSLEIRDIDTPELESYVLPEEPEEEVREEAPEEPEDEVREEVQKEVPKEVKDVKKPEKPLERQRPSRGKVMFTINDRFLFSRELFGGSAADFDAALRDVAGMDSYEEAEDYFFYEKGWNPDRQEVKQFMKIIRKVF